MGTITMGTVGDGDNICPRDLYSVPTVRLAYYVSIYYHVRKYVVNAVYLYE